MGSALDIALKKLLEWSSRFAAPVPPSNGAGRPFADWSARFYYLDDG